MMHVMLTVTIFLSANILYCQNKIYSKTASEFAAIFPETTIIQCTDGLQQTYKPFPLYPQHQDKFLPSITFNDQLIISIPNGTIYFSPNAYFYINNFFIKETQVNDLDPFNNRAFLFEQMPNKIYYTPYKVAVISHLYAFCYGHWVLDVLSQLAMLEMSGVQYDYLCTPYSQPFIKEFLTLWGIDPNKIIPILPNGAFKAHTLIIPTITSQVSPYVSNANYFMNHLLEYIREKLLEKVALIHSEKKFPEKIFISRADAGGKRAVPNEAEIFELFKPFGYELIAATPLTVAEKIQLFHNAKSIISFTGSGMANIIFAKPGTQCIEIIQNIIDATSCFIADHFQLNYLYINDTTEKFLYHSPNNPARATCLQTVKDFIEKNKDIL